MVSCERTSKRPARLARWAGAGNIQSMKALLTVLALCGAVVLAGLARAAQTPNAVLIVVTNHAELGDTGERTGYFLSEVAHPWHVFKSAGLEVHFASPSGGFAPMDPKSFDLGDRKNRAFWEDLDAVEGVMNTRELGRLDMDAYAAVFFAGGHGTMFDFPEDIAVQQAIEATYAQGGVVGAVCHGPAALVNARDPSGGWLVEGREVAAFTNEEEAAVNLTEAMPFLLESKLRERGARIVEAPDFQKKVAVDGRLVTGQNPASATGAAEAIVRLVRGQQGAAPVQ